MRVFVIYLIFIVLLFSYGCGSRAIVLISSKEQQEISPLEGKLSFRKKGTSENEGVYMIVDLKSENLKSIWMYLEGKGNENFYKKNPIKINFNKKGEAIYGLLSNNWCIKCKDSTKEVIGKKVIFLDEKKNILKISNSIELK